MDWLCSSCGLLNVRQRQQEEAHLVIASGDVYQPVRDDKFWRRRVTSRVPPGASRPAGGVVIVHNGARV
jgi:hypothetical protein